MKQTILLKKYVGKGKSKTLVTIAHKDGKISFQGDKGLIAMMEAGLPHPSDPTKMIGIDKSQDFIDAIFIHYDSPYLYAELEK